MATTPRSEDANTVSLILAIITKEVIMPTFKKKHPTGLSTTRSSIFTFVSCINQSKQSEFFIFYLVALKTSQIFPYFRRTKRSVMHDDIVHQARGDKHSHDDETKTNEIAIHHSY